MHPIERLRYVARAGGVDQTALAREAADALASLTDDPAELVTACRRILHRHGVAGALWYMSARVLTSTDPMMAAWDVADELSNDPTGDQVAAELPHDAAVVVLGWPDIAAEGLHRRGDLEVRVIDAYGEGGGLARRLMQRDVDVVEVPLTGLGQACASADVVLVEAAAAGPSGLVAASGSLAAASVAQASGVSVWAAVPRGRALPEPLFTALLGRLADSDDAWELDEERVPMGAISHIVGPDGRTDVADGLRADCAVAHELLRAAI
ncbi:MAG: hypothetical protein P8N02_09455 [Actinomycetota bacterium]|nr:hypothetical protein [Actinomycetota bacterium]